MLRTSTRSWRENMSVNGTTFKRKESSGRGVGKKFGSLVFFCLFVVFLLLQFCFQYLFWSYSFQWSPSFLLYLLSLCRGLLLQENSRFSEALHYYKLAIGSRPTLACKYFNYTALHSIDYSFLRNFSYSLIPLPFFSQKLLIQKVEVEIVHFSLKSKCLINNYI